MVPLRSIPRLAVPVLGVLWLVAIVVGLGTLWRHANTPGRAGGTPAEWPSQSSLVRAANRKTLVMFAHPKCPCTRATIGELALLMARCGADLDAYVVFLKPEDTPDEWSHTSSFRDAEAIPGVKVILDKSGREAKLFRAATSGQADLYDVYGHLLFSGGITVARGHAGDNPGRTAIVEWASNDQADRSSMPVYGCAITPVSSQTPPLP